MILSLFWFSEIFIWSFPIECYNVSWYFKIPEPHHTQNNAQCSDVERIGLEVFLKSICSLRRNPSTLVQFCLRSQISHYQIYAAAILALATLTWNPARFLNLKTLNRSKSVKAALLACFSRFCAHGLCCHNFSIPAFSHSFLTTPVRAALGRPLRTRGVRTTLAREIACLGTAASLSVAGPSIRAYFRCQISALLSNSSPFLHTRLWSMISTIAASLPSCGPPVTRTTRPTSTSLHEDALISASPIVIASEKSDIS
ncbi:hypothetical protein EYC84_000958 [Monilinia fructicola]|uniref:Uncharacterized protein n=1 Tax=Monilinia fructicola TaxID=38448 RepID=A0A5M9JJ44_MONFR|nr:hypothetical protein EYC84_000958 [Monilinia fructicola]